MSSPAPRVGYAFEEGVATIRMDDGKVNALSPDMLAELNRAFDRAEAERAAVLLCGRDGVFSAGFDLKVLRGGGAQAQKMLRAGFELAYRMLAFPRPIALACTGHALAMGSFLVLSADLRIGADAEHRIGANEVAIGLTMPWPALEICRARLAPAHFQRAVNLAEIYAPRDAVAAGFLDRVVPPAELHATALQAALDLAKLDASAHAATKLRTRQQALEALRAAIEGDPFLRVEGA
jgi:enoyl-CoA hydratase